MRAENIEGPPKPIESQPSTAPQASIRESQDGKNDDAEDIQSV